MSESEGQPPQKVTVIEEKAKIEKKVVDAATVQIKKIVREEEETISIPLSSEKIQVQRITINKIVETMPSVRHESDTVIIPVVKEVLVIEKKLMLVEEIHLSKEIIEKNEENKIVVRKEEVVVDRIPH